MSTATAAASSAILLLLDTAKQSGFISAPKLCPKQHHHHHVNKIVAKATPTQNQTPPNSPSISRRNRRPQNVDGDLFVDHTCIDCDTCRWMAPAESLDSGRDTARANYLLDHFGQRRETFIRVDGMSAVYKQPSCEEDRLRALQALLSCPTSSIRTENSPRDILEVQKTFPMPIDEKIEGVYHCGYHSEKSYGAASYLVVHPEGNILVDSPRFTERLARNIELMGGAHYMFLTHKDDVADHEKWSKRLDCKRILHVEDVTLSTADVEVKLEGNGPWILGDDFILVHTPGHTAGSVCLLYKSKQVLFTGDHLMMDDCLSIMEQYNWFSVPMQLNSVQKLLELDFEWILPGHRRRVAFGDVEEKNSVLKAFLATKVATSR